jgi:thiamine biosynthesis lipoprotein
LLVLAWVLGGCGAREPFRQESYVFGTRIELLIQGEEEAKASAAAGEVLREFDRLHRSYHAWEDSELTALNKALAEGRSSEVSPELADLLQQAQRLARAGDYLFDPGIGGLIRLWGFQSDTPPTALPDASVVKTWLAQKPSIGALKFEGLRVSSRNPAVALDFGGMVKGYALDRAALILRARGVRNALINIGGNVMALGSKEGKPWRVGIQHPRAERVGGVPLATLELHDGEAIGTSGDYHRFFMANGRRHFHVLDPRTGAPAYGTAAVTVLISAGEAPGLRSDVLSKPIFVAGKDWLPMAKKLDVGAVLRVGAGTGREDGRDGAEVIEATQAMKARLVIQAPDVRLLVRN